MDSELLWIEIVAKSLKNKSDKTQPITQKVNKPTANPDYGDYQRNCALESTSAAGLKEGRMLGSFTFRLRLFPLNQVSNVSPLAAGHLTG